MKNGKRWTVAACFALMTLLGTPSWAVDAYRQTWAEVRTEMEAKGWKEIAEGVFERQLGPNKVEHKGYGREGLAWMIGDQTRRLENLMQEFELYPSEQLAKVIDDVSLTVATLKRDLKTMPEGVSKLTGTVTGGNCSSICYSATADAYPLTNDQGVGAVADAAFSSSCGYSGTTSAYAYARATVGTTTTTVSQTDPDSGTSISSHAAVSTMGGSISGTPCYSEASATAASTALAISYSTSDTNSSCPVPVCAPTISGTTFEEFAATTVCRTRTWTASASGCSSSPTYQWYKNGVAISGATSSTYTQSICHNNASFTLKVVVTGVNSPNHGVTVFTCGLSGYPLCP